MDVAVASAHRVKAACLVQKAEHGIVGAAGVAAGAGYAAGHKDGHGAGVQGGGIDLHVGVPVGGQLAAQGVNQLVVGKPCCGHVAHFGQVHVPVRPHGQGAIDVEVATPQTHHHPVAGSDDGAFLVVGKIALKKIGRVRPHVVIGPGCATKGQQRQDGEKVMFLQHGVPKDKTRGFAAEPRRAPAIVTGSAPLKLRLGDALSPHSGSHDPSPLFVLADNHHFGFFLPGQYCAAFAVFTLGRGEDFVNAHVYALAELYVVHNSGLAGGGKYHEAFHRARGRFSLLRVFAKAAGGQGQGEKKCGSQGGQPVKALYA